MAFTQPTFSPLSGGGGRGQPQVGQNPGGTKETIGFLFPRDVRVFLEPGGKFFTVKWKDYNTSQASPASFRWSVRYCPQALAGNSTGTSVWALDVLYRSVEVGSVLVAGHGEQMSVTLSTTGLSNGYVLVVAHRLSNDTRAGVSSVPIFINMEGNSGQIPDTPRTATVVVSRERTPYDVVRLDLGFTPPADMTKDFNGVHVHMVGYYGTTAPVEIGDMALWDKTTGLNAYTRRLPVETGQGSGTATFTNASAAVVRVSGTNFAAGWVGRKILIDTSATASSVYQVNTVTPTNNLTLTAVFTGTTGTYTWRVLHAINFYFVSVGLNGSRTGDYTTATLVSI